MWLTYMDHRGNTTSRTVADHLMTSAHRGALKEIAAMKAHVERLRADVIELKALYWQIHRKAYEREK